MEDFFYAGGLPAVLRQLLPLLHGSALTVNGRSIADNVKDAKCYYEDVIRPLSIPMAGKAAPPSSFGNLCPDGAVLKQSAASPHLITHRGRAVVFEDHADLHKRIDDESFAIDENSVLVLKQVGPRGAPGAPEWGAAPIPKRLLKRGVNDMVRISSARLSGTSCGTVVLHVAPESAIGGPLALVRDGRVSDEELARRQARLGAAAAPLHARLRQALPRSRSSGQRGVDFDYLNGRTPVRFEDTSDPRTAEVSHAEKMHRLAGLEVTGCAETRSAPGWYMFIVSVIYEPTFHGIVRA